MNQGLVMTNTKEHKTIGKWLRVKREEACLSRAQLAGLIGRNESFIGRYESGVRLDVIQFAKIVIALKADPCKVFKQCLENVEQE
jgi:transcriptional regulator with XRE-family HTH domain